METTTLTLIDKSLLDNNEGQVPGLHPNPREIDNDNYERLKTQIQDYPELIDYRALMVYPHNGRFVAIGGNMRLRALKELGYEKIPCFIIPEETEPEDLNAFQILDNVPFGKWDFTKLAEGWDIDQLKGFNINIPVPQSSLNLGDFFDEGDDETKTKIIVVLPERLRAMKDEIKDAIKEHLTNNSFPGCKVK